jgi:hypothetical protein
VGKGQAGKEQVAHMVGILTGVKEFATSDASDGLALAICHAQTLGSKLWNAGQPALQQNTLAKRSSRRLSLAEACGVTAEMIAGKGAKK